MNYIYVENEKIIGCGEFPVTNDDISNTEVSEEIYTQYLKDTDKFIWDNGTIKENPEYDSIKKRKRINAEIEQVNEKLSILDLKRIRAVCEDEVRNEKTGETWLDFYNSQIYDLRTRLKSLEAQL